MTEALHKLRFRGELPADQELEFPLKRIPVFKNPLHSPMVGNAHDTKQFDYTKYEEYTWEVHEVVQDVLRDKYPTWFLEKHWPERWGSDDLTSSEILEPFGAWASEPKGCANIVKMDRPNDLARAIRDWLYEQGEPRLKNNADQNFPFLKLFPDSEAGVAKYISEALYKAFQVKYHYGVARPSEVWAKLHGKDTLDFYKFIKHPSYCAGHSAVAAATARYFLDNFVLTARQVREIKKAAYMFGMFRTFAGVHYAVDNIEGLKVGGLDVY